MHGYILIIIVTMLYNYMNVYLIILLNFLPLIMCEWVNIAISQSVSDLISLITVCLLHSGPLFQVVRGTISYVIKAVDIASWSWARHSS